MGDGFVYYCKKCGERYSLMLGVGMEYPRVYDEIMGKLFNGDFGLNLQKIVQSTENVVVDAQDYLYVCEKCGNFNVTNGLDLYQVKNEELIRENTDKNKKWIKGWFFRFNPKDFRILKRVKYACPQCKSRMKRYGDYMEPPKLKCPECHEDLEEGGFICWD